MIQSILIANRGEIALRIIRSAKELGIKAGVIYSREDANSLAVKNADEAFFIDSSANQNPYLKLEEIVDIAVKRGYDSIHPGYGFLAENEQFAQECEEKSIIFIGPSVKVIEDTGDKSKIKKIARDLKIPVINEYNYKKINKIDLPVLLKSVFGGGGRGIRKVETMNELKKNYELVKRESQRSFGKSKIIIEDFINKPRHVEVQILADKKGNIIHVFERECSIQRNNQKIIEEAPCNFIKTATKQKIFNYSKKLAKKIGFYGAGTFEYLIDQEEKIYFLEVNPRIQVEHPITEEITGIDIVREQIFIASNRTLKLNQKNLKVKGHSIELRINAEDVLDNFKISTGKISEVILPGGAGIRICGDVFIGKNIYPDYDSMLIKLIITGKNRDEAMKKAENALDEISIKGIKTNIPLLKAIVNSEKFKNGDLSTNFIKFNNSIKAAKKIDKQKNQEEMVNLKELEFERTAYIAANIYERMNKQLNSNEKNSNWTLNSRLNSFK